MSKLDDTEKQWAITEPKKVFTNIILIPLLRTIGAYMFTPHAPLIEQVRAMKTLIGHLDENAQKDLDHIYKKLESYDRGARPMTRIEIEQIFRDMNVYLHKTYLKGFHTRLGKDDFEKEDEEKP